MCIVLKTQDKNRMLISYKGMMYGIKTFSIGYNIVTEEYGLIPNVISHKAYKLTDEGKITADVVTQSVEMPFSVFRLDSAYDDLPVRVYRYMTAMDLGMHVSQFLLDKEADYSEFLTYHIKPGLLALYEYGANPLKFTDVMDVRVEEDDVVVLVRFDYTDIMMIGDTDVVVSQFEIVKDEAEVYEFFQLLQKNAKNYLTNE